MYRDDMTKLSACTPVIRHWLHGKVTKQCSRDAKQRNMKAETMMRKIGKERVFECMFVKS